MGKFRKFMHRKRRVAKGVTFVMAVTAFTAITLVSCSGVTYPCVTCKRTPASDPFVSAEELSWTERESESEKRKRRDRMRDHRDF